ncbi:cellulose biosynthesis cyclic di-GMP-binding regulatory protein BcsB [Aromatoleum bremense]|uniref:Cyclic di-GMP-binding protein n=1 Tax=Aromatoleum bremense TaxID=76115 RepID=A0ABX1NUW9_9RHOO|nr:cellulose biosynthesis cyclic di-GMP-binding regulatory protein BcsB [Aromatoleum bremense]NMG15350.1 cellulose biosynthesis cyclic di-GMP-binding regulatory protein BcsB [Aromatoleum bremense]QTQ33173.1 Cyclic di-GMP-binding protein [Aromatoleum bremense]
MNRHFRKFLFGGLALLLAAGALAATASPATAATRSVTPPQPPAWQTTRTFARLGRPDDTLLLGIRNSDQIEFGLRRDRIANEAGLRLQYTPSPALLPTLSHLRIYLNDALMSVLPIEKEHLGRPVHQQVALDPRLLADFNRVRIEFIGHYTDICEDPAHSALWLSVSRDSSVVVREQALVLHNDLAYFPAPFFDARETARLVVPIVFAAAPGLGEQRAAAILASYFGSEAGWRGASFPVLFDRLPEAEAGKAPQSAIVFASNDRRPAFLADTEKYPPVDAPVVELIDHPHDPYAKILLVLGRDADDLASAATALVLGGELFRGARVTVNRVQRLEPRKPYDAPNWMRTDRPVRFGELIDYPGQLQVSGLQPRPVVVDVNLPPDLFVWRNQGVPLRTVYRYTAPNLSDESRLNVSINDQFISSLPLQSSEQGRVRLEELRLNVLSGDAGAFSDKLLVPALKLGDHNRIRFDFNFASVLASAQRDRCQTMLPVDMRAIIDEESSIDLSGYHHYIGMPDLGVFVRSGFPFSRMADLSETLAVVPAGAGATQVGVLLDVVAGIAARTGYPALGLRLSDDWRTAAATDADLLLLGRLPDELRDDPDLELLLERSRDWSLRPGATHTVAAESRVDISAGAPIAAIVGMQSPSHAQRSVVALLASEAGDYELLRAALADPQRLNAVAGSVSLIRSSGVVSQAAGERYFVGSLPWWLLTWFHLSAYPVLLAVLATISVALAAFLLWRVLRWAARQRLAGDA